MYSAINDDSSFCFLAGACFDKCNVYIPDLDYQNAYSVRQIYVTIGTEETFKKSSCQTSHKKYVSMYIDCSWWNKS